MGTGMTMMDTDMEKGTSVRGVVPRCDESGKSDRSAVRCKVLMPEIQGSHVQARTPRVHCSRALLEADTLTNRAWARAWSSQSVRRLRRSAHQPDALRTHLWNLPHLASRIRTLIRGRSEERMWLSRISAVSACLKFTGPLLIRLWQVLGLATLGLRSC